MLLVASLGNPSPAYDGTRHSLGHRCVALWRTTVAAEPVNVPGVARGVYAATVAGEKLLIANDCGTYMNESGQPIAVILRFFNIGPASLILVHDDVALPLGTIRISRDASSAGHRGVQSVIDALRTQDFVRLRLGVESRPPGSPLPTDDFVLQRFTPDEQPLVGQTAQRGAAALTLLLTSGLEQAMAEYNRGVDKKEEAG